MSRKCGIAVVKVWLHSTELVVQSCKAYFNRTNSSGQVTVKLPCKVFVKSLGVAPLWELYFVSHCSCVFLLVFLILYLIHAKNYTKADKKVFVRTTMTLS